MLNLRSGDYKLKIQFEVKEKEEAYIFRDYEQYMLGKLIVFEIIALL